MSIIDGIKSPEEKSTPHLYRSTTNKELWVCDGWASAMGRTPREAYANWVAYMLIFYPTLAANDYGLRQTETAS